MVAPSLLFQDVIVTLPHKAYTPVFFFNFFKNLNGTVWSALTKNSRNFKSQDSYTILKQYTVESFKTNR